MPKETEKSAHVNSSIQSQGHDRQWDDSRNVKSGSTKEGDEKHAGRPWARVGAEEKDTRLLGRNNEKKEPLNSMINVGENSRTWCLGETA